MCPCVVAVVRWTGSCSSGGRADWTLGWFSGPLLEQPADEGYKQARLGRGAETAPSILLLGEKSVDAGGRKWERRCSPSRSASSFFLTWKWILHQRMSRKLFISKDTTFYHFLIIDSILKAFRQTGSLSTWFPHLWWSHAHTGTKQNLESAWSKQY